MSNKTKGKKHSDKEKKEEEEEDDKHLALNDLTIPIHVSHVKPGNTICTNDEILVLQDGSTTVEVRLPPTFEPKKVPWRQGLIRDMAWCSELGLFVLLTQKNLYTFNPKALIAPATATINTDIQLTVNSYAKIKPCEEKYSFWRCTCAGTTIYISYSGFGTIIDEYVLGETSCQFVTRWTPPQTCATYEGIWCIRQHPHSNELGMTIMDARNNQWRFEIRDPKSLTIIWRTDLPLPHGDCELSPLVHGQWLIVNSCGIRLVQISHQKLKAAVEYERELKNAIRMGEEYFVVRSKNTLEVHLAKKKKKD